MPHEHAQMARSVLGSLCYQLTAPTQGSGQADILLWPQASLHNGLPVDVAFSLKGDAEMSGRGTLCGTCFTPKSLSKCISTLYTSAAWPNAD